MAPVSSKNCDEQELARRARVTKAAAIHIFQTICQYSINLQTEPLLFRELCGGDVAKASRIMGGSMSLVAILGLSINQGGGRLSDSIGRKPFCFIGALLNVLIGSVMFAAPKSLRLAVICRIIRVIGISFSGTIMANAAIMDTYPADEFPLQNAKVQAAAGLAIITTPVLEGIILSKSGGNLHASYLMLAALGAVHAFTTSSLMEESLAPKDRKPLSMSEVFKASNPFGFLRIFTGPCKELKKLLSITTLQYFIEAKNMSDVQQLYMVNQLGWGVPDIRNYAVTYGSLVVGQSVAVVPALIKKLGIAGFTTLANVGNALAWTLTGSVESGKAMMGGLFLFGIPGTNGAATNGIRGVCNQLAADAGYGGGEFSAIFNSLRSIASAIATSVLGFAYGYCRDNGIKTGYTYLLAAFLGAVLPQILLQTLDKGTLQPSPKQKVDNVVKA